MASGVCTTTRPSQPRQATRCPASVDTATLPERESFLRELWEASPPSGTYRYYDGMLYMLALLETSGNFRAYAPK